MNKLHKVHWASNRSKVVGVSLSKPQTIVEELHCTCVCMLACCFPALTIVNTSVWL